LRGIYVAPGVVGRIIALSRQPINGIIERPDIPGVPPKPRTLGLGIRPSFIISSNVFGDTQT